MEFRNNTMGSKEKGTEQMYNTKT
jgi:hypothetical protein